MNEKIRILHISPDGKLYGTERHILAIVKYSNKNLFRHTVAVPSEGNFKDELDRMGIECIIAGREHGYTSKLANVTGSGSRKLFKELRSGKYDIVHSHLNSFGAFAGRITGAKAVVHTRHGVFWSEDELENVSAVSKNFQKLKSSVFDLTIAIGEYERKTLIEKFGYNPDKIRQTINGVDVDEIKSRVNNELTKEELFGTSKLVIGSAGRLERQKGFHYFIEAIAGVDPESIDAHFVIIGNGSLREELLSMIRSNGLKDRFVIMDYKSNILDYVSRFDIYVSTSLWEGLSYSVQEAMALAKPVVALSSASVSGLSEIIIDGETGYVIKDNYVEELRKKIVQLSEDKDLRTKMGNESELRERQFFPVDRTAKDMDSYYHEVIESKKKSYTP